MKKIILSLLITVLIFIVGALVIWVFGTIGHFFGKSGVILLTAFIGLWAIVFAILLSETKLK